MALEELYLLFCGANSPEGSNRDWLYTTILSMDESSSLPPKLPPVWGGV